MKETKAIQPLVSSENSGLYGFFLLGIGKRSAAPEHLALDLADLLLQIAQQHPGDYGVGGFGEGKADFAAADRIQRAGYDAGAAGAFQHQFLENGDPQAPADKGHDQRVIPKAVDDFWLKLALF